MNPIDAGLAAVVLVSAWFGIWKGFFRQIFGIISMVVSTAAALIYFKSGGSILASGVVFLVAGGVVQIAFWVWHTRVKKDAELSRVSRIGGGIVGGLIGLVYAALILASVSYVGVLFPAGSGFARAVDGSRLSGLYNALSGKPKRAGVAVPGGPRGIVIDEKEAESLRKNPAIQAMLRDTEFTALLEKRDFAAIMAHPAFRKLMEDPELIKELTAAALGGDAGGESAGISK